jgi:RNA-splicing ligase RtcB
MQKIEEIVDSEVAKEFGIFKDQLCFMLHSDSRAFGQSLFDFYSKKAKRLLGLQQVYKKIHYSIFSSPQSPRALKAALQSLNRALNRVKSILYWKTDKYKKRENLKFEYIIAGTKEEEAYLTSTYSALNFGYANRAYLAAVIRDALRVNLGKDTSIHILIDGNHDSLQKENIDGEVFYVHRNGASRALPAKSFPDHPVFSKTGQPVLLPSALGRHSFLCAAKTGCASSYYSTSHGVGRLMDRGEARVLFKPRDVFSEVEKENMKIYDYGKGYISEEAPGAFKDVDKVMGVLKKHNIAQPVARIRPLAALKGWR